MVDLDAPIEEHEFEIAVAHGKHQILPHRPEDHLRGEVPPLEAIAPTHPDIRPARSGVDHTGNPPTSKLATEPAVLWSRRINSRIRLALQNGGRHKC